MRCEERGRRVARHDNQYFASGASERPISQEADVPYGGDCARVADDLVGPLGYVEPEFLGLDPSKEAWLEEPTISNEEMGPSIGLQAQVLFALAQD